MRPPAPPPPPKRLSATTSTSNTSEDNAISPTPSRPNPPPPPPPKKREINSNTTTEDIYSSPTDAESIQKVSNPIKRPPRKSDIKTIPVEQALQSVLLKENQYEDIEAKTTNHDTELQNYIASTSPSGETDRFFSEKRSNSPQSSKSNLTSQQQHPIADREQSPSFATIYDTKQSTALLRGKLMEGEPTNMIYHKNTFSENWFFIFLIIHTIQFILLLDAANAQLSAGPLAILILMAISVAVLVIIARWYTRKSRLSSARNIRLKHGVCTPEDEADDVSDFSIYCLAAACILEGCAYAIFAAVVAGRSSELNNSGFYTQDTILQVLRFASITLLALHRIIRPANRIDPMRTILELEVVAVCWDAIDGSTVYELLDGSTIDAGIAAAARVLMVVWYVSVGVRMALMFLAHLQPTASLYSSVVTYPFQLAPQPTVDRTLQALRIRSIIIMTMACADIYAAVIRTTLWARGELNTLQQEMVLKNYLFLAVCSFAYDMYINTLDRNWNTRVIDFIFFTVHYPKRERQMDLLRWGFVASYMILSVCMSLILIHTTIDSDKWTTNVVIDAILCVIFLVYCRWIHIKADVHEPKWFFIPRDRFFGFPFSMALILGGAMATSLLGARIPAIYYNYTDMAASGVLWTYNNALLCVSLSILPITLYSYYWSLGYMLFRKEFTAVPGNYNAIHDPAIQMMSVATMTEGALDILSCATLMQLAQNDLPGQMNGAIVLFCLLEVFNACQSMAFQVTLSGGHDDTPLDLVRWNAYLRTLRALIDSGAIILRLVLWIEYNAVSSVFLVKNIYNLIHTISQIERWKSVGRYPKETLFSQFVAPQEWYGLTNEQWRKATSETIAAQARSGRRV